MKFVLGITGASGAPYAKSVLTKLLSLDHEVHTVITDAGRRVLHHELGEGSIEEMLGVEGQDKFKLFPLKDIGAAPASGTADYQGMAIAPCSMGTLGRIAHGTGDRLIERAADVMLKEDRRLVILFREAPLNLIHLRNLTTLKEAGAVVMPAAPAFYQKPQSLEEAVDFLAERVVGLLTQQYQGPRWDGQECS